MFITYALLERVEEILRLLSKKSMTTSLRRLPLELLIKQVHARFKNCATNDEGTLIAQRYLS